MTEPASDELEIRRASRTPSPASLAPPPDRARGRIQDRGDAHIVDSASDYLDSDAVFAVKRSLVRSFVERSADDPERPPAVEGPWVSLELGLVLATRRRGERRARSRTHRPRGYVAARAADAARRRLISRDATTAITRIPP